LDTSYTSSSLSNQGKYCQRPGIALIKESRPRECD
jgi:hypothetical protein